MAIFYVNNLGFMLDIVYVALLGRPAVNDIVFDLLEGDLVETESSRS